MQVLSINSECWGNYLISGRIVRQSRQNKYSNNAAGSGDLAYTSDDYAAWELEEKRPTEHLRTYLLAFRLVKLQLDRPFFANKGAAGGKAVLKIICE
jgi:hypothetical protein